MSSFSLEKAQSSAGPQRSLKSARFLSPVYTETVGGNNRRRRSGVTALHSAHSHVFRGVVIVAGSNLARSHGCVCAHVSQLNEPGRTLPSVCTEAEGYPCFSAKVPQDVSIITPMRPSLQPLILERNLLSWLATGLQQMSKLSEFHCFGLQNSPKSLRNLEMMTR